MSLTSPGVSWTMIKRLILLAFLALAVAMAVPSTRARLGEAVTPIMDNIAGRIVPRRVKVMADQLDVRLGRAEGFPANFDGWLRRDYTGDPQDPWGNVYYLQIGRRDYTVGSMGPDGVQGTEDDIFETRQIPGSR